MVLNLSKGDQMKLSRVILKKEGGQGVKVKEGGSNLIKEDQIKGESLPLCILVFIRVLFLPNFCISFTGERYVVRLG